MQFANVFSVSDIRISQSGTIRFSPAKTPIFIPPNFAAIYIKAGVGFGAVFAYNHYRVDFVYIVIVKGAFKPGNVHVVRDYQHCSVSRFDYNFSARAVGGNYNVIAVERIAISY